jgi:hypothetical protein
MATTQQEPNAIGVFDDLDQAQQTINELQRAGFQPDEIGIIGHVGDSEAVPAPLQTHAPEDNAITGMTRGAFIGAVVGALVILVIPLVSEVSGLGRWFDIVGGALLGAIAAGILVAFSGVMFSRPEGRFVANQLEKGRFVVTVKNPARKDEAVSVLRRQGMHHDRM